MMAQSFLIASCFALYAMCDWLMWAGADLLVKVMT